MHAKLLLEMLTEEIGLQKLSSSPLNKMKCHSFVSELRSEVLSFQDKLSNLHNRDSHSCEISRIQALA